MATDTEVAADPLDVEQAELELRAEWLRLQRAYRDAKANHPRESPEYQAAKAAFSTFRTYWRGIRDYLTDNAAGGATVTVTDDTTTGED